MLLVSMDLPAPMSMRATEPSTPAFQPLLSRNFFRASSARKTMMTSFFWAPNCRPIEAEEMIDGLAADAERPFPVLAADPEAGLDDAGEDTDALGVLEEFGRALHFLLEPVERRVDLGVDLLAVAA